MKEKMDLGEIKSEMLSIMGVYVNSLIASNPEVSKKLYDDDFAITPYVETLNKLSTANIREHFLAFNMSLTLEMVKRPALVMGRFIEHTIQCTREILSALEVSDFQKGSFKPLYMGIAKFMVMFGDYEHHQKNCNQISFVLGHIAYGDLLAKAENHA